MRTRCRAGIARIVHADFGGKCSRRTRRTRRFAGGGCGSCRALTKTAHHLSLARFAWLYGARIFVVRERVVLVRRRGASLARIVLGTRLVIPRTYRNVLPRTAAGVGDTLSVVISGAKRGP